MTQNATAVATPAARPTASATAGGSGYQSSGMPAMAAPALLDYQAPMGVDPQSGIGAQASALVNRTITYTYDSLNRLTAADYDDGTYFYYEYDEVGNRLNQETLEGTNTYAYDIANRLTSVDGVPTSYILDINMGLTQVLADGTNAYLYGQGRIAQEGSSNTDYFSWVMLCGKPQHGVVLDGLDNKRTWFQVLEGCDF